MLRQLVCLIFCWTTATVVSAAEARIDSDDAALEPALKQLQLAPGLKAELFAAEPLLKNPVSFSIDEQGRFFIAETHRFGISVLDITANTPWLLDDLSFRTVQDRADFLARAFATNFSMLTAQSEAIRLVQDTDHDGRADTTKLVADGFNSSVSGIAAGVLAQSGRIWFASVPDLWLLTETNASPAPGPGGPKPADGFSIERITGGLGVHIGVSGHDVHGLIEGPDGRIYFSFGDRGVSFTNREGAVIEVPDTGGVLRCEPDGGNLELFCVGLRNPQELAFDNEGNLWTVDNDTAGADPCRVLHLVEDADYGWRASYQHMKGFGPWVQEELWRGTLDGILPPAGTVSQGPAGLAFRRGRQDTGGRFAGRFVHADFPGGVWAFDVEPRGASFVLGAKEKIVWNCWPTDVEFGPDGALYVLDWVQGWRLPDRGRIYRITATDDEIESERASPPVPRFRDSDPVEATQREKRAGAAPLDGAALATLARDASLRVRFEATMALGSLEDFTEHVSADGLIAQADANEGTDPFLRHAIVRQWIRVEQNEAGRIGYGGISNGLRARCTDPSPATRLAAALVLRGLTNSFITNLLADADARVALTAARAIHDLPIPDAFPALAALMDDIRFTRHDWGAEILPSRSPQSPRDQLLRRALNAHFRLGTAENAEALARFASRSSAELSPALRREALFLLSAWEVKPAHPGRLPVRPPKDPNHGSTPSVNPENWPGWFDRVVGLWRPLGPRPADVARAALTSRIEQLIQDAEMEVATGAIEAAVALDLTNAAPSLMTVLTEGPATVRASVVPALAQLQAPELSDAVASALKDPEREVRVSALPFLDRLQPGVSTIILGDLLDAAFLGSNPSEDAVRLAHGALAVLGKMQSTAANELLVTGLDHLLAGKLPAALELDLLEATARRENPEITARLEKVQAGMDPTDPAAAWRAVLVGGDPERGRAVFFEKPEVQCSRCHRMQGDGGTVGPELDGIGTRMTRKQLLESILFPNKNIAPGFEHAVVRLKNGATYAGLVQRENASELLIESPEDGPIAIARDQIEERQAGLSAMPDNVHQLLSKRSLRDLIEFLARSKTR